MGARLSLERRGGGGLSGLVMGLRAPWTMWVVWGQQFQC